MKRVAAARAVLGAVAAGAAVMLVVSVVHDPAQVATASAQVTAAEPTTETTSPALETQATPSPSPTLSPAESAALAQRVQEAVRKSVPGAQVGMEVFDRTTGTALTSLNADTTFSSMSVVKLLIAIDLLARNDWALPDTATQNRITRMLSASDDAIASSFWESDGGTAIITRDVALMGLTGTSPPDTPGEWGDTQVTAADLVTVYRYLADDVPAAAHDLIYDAMYHASRDGADGTDQYFGIPNGLPGTTWAIKQGWGSSGSTAYYNTTGLLGQDSRYVVVVLSSAPLSYYRALGRALTNGTAQLASLVSP